MLWARRLGAWSCGGALFALAATATAAVSLPDRPRGFVEPTAEAEARAEAWASAIGGRAVQVFATEEDDDYAETLAVIEVDGALPLHLDRDPSGALFDAFGDALGQTDVPVEAEARLDDEGNPGPIIGRFDGETETWFVALASGGPSHARVILSVPTEEATIYDNVFDATIADLQGVAPPLPPFKISRWRIGVVGAWVAFVSIAWMFLARLREDDTIRERARAVAITCIIAAIVAFTVAWFALGRSLDTLALAGLGRAWVAAEAALIGIAAAAIALIAGAVRESQVQPIQSAPEGGAFGRVKPVLPRRVTRPPELVPARVDGPSTLAPAKEPEAVPLPPAEENTFRGVAPPPPPPPSPSRPKRTTKPRV